MTIPAITCLSLSLSLRMRTWYTSSATTVWNSKVLLKDVPEICRSNLEMDGPFSIVGAAFCIFLLVVQLSSTDPVVSATPYSILLW